MFGDVLADILQRQSKKAVVIGSTDLTHYGPSYGFTPMGSGSDGLRWAREVNDRTFVDLALSLESERLLSCAVNKGNACGPGAAAAAIVVARKFGVQSGFLLGQTTSNEIMRDKMGTTSNDSVGYAAMVF